MDLTALQRELAEAKRQKLRSEKELASFSGSQSVGGAVSQEDSLDAYMNEVTSSVKVGG